MNARNEAPALGNLESFIAACEDNEGSLHGREFLPDTGERPVLLVSHELSLSGAPIVLLSMSQSLKKLGWKPMVIAPAAGPLQDAYLHEEIPVLICPRLLKSDLILRGAALFSFIVLNTAVCAHAADLLNGTKTPVLWWVHEAEVFYQTYYVNLMPFLLFSNIKVVTAGSWARRLLLQNRPAYLVEDMFYYIPDQSAQSRTTESPFLFPEAEGKRLFALVGAIEPRKGQDVLLETIERLPENAARQCFFLFVGQKYHRELAARVQKAAAAHPDRIQYIPQIDHEDMPGLYSNIDCLICASRDDPLPVTVAEACQFSKAVICSEHTGMAPLLEHDRAGFVYGDDDPAALAECIMQFLDQSAEDAAAMRERARKFYLSYFSSASFDRRLETEILPELLGPDLLRGKPDKQDQLLRLTENSRQRLLQLERKQKQEYERVAALKLEQDRIIREKEVRIEFLEMRNRELTGTAEMRLARAEELEVQNRYLSESFDIISNSTCWKMTKPVRFVLDVVKWLHSYAGQGLVRKGFYSLRTNGFHVTWQKAIQKIYFGKSFVRIAKQRLFSEEELAQQRSHRFPRQIKFSIVVPLYNTPESFLRAMIESVLAQTYADWELCMADGSDKEHDEVERICREYLEKDRRIRYRKLEKNFGISGNTNACLEMADGDYIGLFDHDDLLHPAALYEVMTAICDLKADFIYTDENIFHDTPEDAFLPHFKPDFAPDNLRANNYICHFTVFQRSLLDEAGRFDPDCDGSQDHDMVLRLTEKAERIAHIPEILYYWRAHKGSVAESVGVKPYVIKAGIHAVEKQLQRLGLEGEVSPVNPGLTIYRIRYSIKGSPKVSILIPNYEHLDDLENCLHSIFSKTTWPNYEIVIVENNSSSPELFSYYDKVQQEHENVRVVKWEGKFNFSAINNYGAGFCTGEYLLLLNNDTEVITPDWIQEMLMFAQRPDVGAVGAKLYYPDNTIQHAGVCLGMGGVAAHYFQYTDKKNQGYMGRLLYPQDMTGVTGACMLLRRDVWEKVGGLDEAWAVAFNDVDLCMRIRRAGFLIIWTPFAELYHYESKSRGIEDTPEKQKRFNEEVLRFQTHWAKELEAGDPYYNPNFVLDKSDFSIKPAVRQYDAR